MSSNSLVTSLRVALDEAYAEQKRITALIEGLESSVQHWSMDSTTEEPQEKLLAPLRAASATTSNTRRRAAKKETVAAVATTPIPTAVAPPVEEMIAPTPLTIEDLDLAVDEPTAEMLAQVAQDFTTEEVAASVEKKPTPIKGDGIDRSKLDKLREWTDADEALLVKIMRRKKGGDLKVAADLLHRPVATCKARWSTMRDDPRWTISA